MILAGLLSGCGGEADQARLRQAEDLITEGKPAQARRAYEDFIRARPDSPLLPRALLGLASVDHLHLQQFERALAAYRHLVGLFPAAPEARTALERMADLHLNTLKNYAQAAQVFRQLKDKYPGDRADYYLERMSWCYFLREDYDQARATIRRLLAEFPASPLAEEALVRLADSFYVEDKMPEALQAYRQALEKVRSPQVRGRAAFRLGNCLEELGQLKEAVPVYQELLKTYENPEAVRIRLEAVQERLKKGVKEAPYETRRSRGRRVGN